MSMVDSLPPTQELIMEVLAARYRSGEHVWTFSARLRRSMRVLEHLGLIGWKSGTVPNTVLAWLTDTGRAEVLLDGYESAWQREAFRARSMLARLMDAVDDDSESRMSDEMRAAGRFLRGAEV